MQPQALQATAAFWMNDFATLYAVGRSLLSHLEAGSVRWCHLLSGLSMGAGLSANQESLLALLQLLLETEPRCHLVARGARAPAPEDLAHVLGRTMQLSWRRMETTPSHPHPGLPRRATSRGGLACSRREWT